MFTVKAEGFVSKKLNNTSTFTTAEGEVITYINTSIGSRYTNPHTKEVTWENLRVLIKGKVATAFESEVKPGDLVSVEGALHEKSYKDKAGNTRYYMECTVHSYRKLQIRKKAETTTEQSNPAQGLSKEFLATLSPEQVMALAGMNN